MPVSKRHLKRRLEIRARKRKQEEGRKKELANLMLSYRRAETKKEKDHIHGRMVVANTPPKEVVTPRHTRMGIIFRNLLRKLRIIQHKA